MQVSSVSGGLTSASTTALRGVRAAERAFAASASETARAGTEASPELEAAPIPTAEAGAGLLDLQASPDLASATVSGMVAQRAYEMNLSVLRSADRMAGAALKLLG